MTPPRSRHSARSLKQILCTVHKIAALGDPEKRKKVDASRHLSHFQPSNPATRIPGNPLDCLRQASLPPRPAQIGQTRIQDCSNLMFEKCGAAPTPASLECSRCGDIPLKGAGSSTDVKMHPPGKSAGHSRTPIFDPMKNHSAVNPVCRQIHFATNRSEMITGSIRSSLFCLNPNTWHVCCLNGGCHGH